MSRVKWVAVGLLGWMVLSVLAAVMVGKAIKAHQEPLDLLDPEAVLERRAYLAERERLEYLEHLGKWASRGSQDRWGQPVSKDNPVHPVRPARLVQPDPPDL